MLMCCRYWIERSPEMDPIIEEVKKSPLASRWIQWTGIKTAIFKYNGEHYEVILTEEESCLVPHEVPAPDIHLEFDGFSKDYHDVTEMKVKLSRKNIKLLRLETYDFWNKVKSKFL